jgi:uncharacterized membrane protein
MRTSEKIGLLIVAVAFIIAVNLYPDMPDDMPAHWNAAGEVDGYLPKLWGLFLMPVISLAMLILFVALPRYTSLRNNIRSVIRQYDIFLVVVLGFMLYIYTLTLTWALGIGFGMVQMLVPAFAALFYVIGMLIQNVKRNKYMGIRTPWTLASDQVWQKTHRLAGKLFRAVAVVILLGLLFDNYIALAFLIGPILAVVAYTMAYSYFEYKKENRKQ